MEYRGVKTKEERSIEQFVSFMFIYYQFYILFTLQNASYWLMHNMWQEEQKVIEAQLRIRQQALKDEEDKLKRKQSRCSSSRTVAPTTEVEYRDICSTSCSG